MRYQPLLAIALLVAATSFALGNSDIEKKERIRLHALRDGNTRPINLTPLERAYLDASGLLGAEGQCRQFFVGNGSQEVLEELVAKLQVRFIGDSRIGIMMSGLFSNLVEPTGGLKYRLFERMEINSAGAFFRAKTFPAEPYVPNMGSFRPNTREARVLILLHELAHLIKGKEGTWLIPDDGSSSQLSRLNTSVVEASCGQQIRGL